MQRRNFLTGILASGFAPAAFSSGIGLGILMPVRQLQVAGSTFFLDGVHDDGVVFRKFLQGQDVYFNGKRVDVLNSWELKKLTFENSYNRKVIGMLSESREEAYFKDAHGLRLEHIGPSPLRFGLRPVSNRFSLVQPRIGKGDNHPFSFKYIERS